MNTKEELKQLTEEPLKSDCTGESLWEQEYNNTGLFKRLWWWLKDLFS